MVFRLDDGSEWKRIGRVEEEVYREQPGRRAFGDRERLWLEVEGTSRVVEVRRYMGKQWAGPGAF